MPRSPSRYLRLVTLAQCHEKKTMSGEDVG